jgi:large subunit ribosomal protein L13
MKTQSTKLTDIKREWHLIDLKGQVIGRTATKIANLLMGKSKPYFVPNLDCGDYVVIINAKQGVMTGKKTQTKVYDAYSGYPGGRKEKTYAQLINEKPQRIITEAVSGMLPKNKLRADRLARLFVFADDKHPYAEKIKSS